MPAGAQADVLVTNFGQPDGGGFSLLHNKDLAQPFGTGNGGATLSSIDIKLRNNGASPAAPPTMQIFTGSVSGTALTLATAVATMTGPATIGTGASTVTYTALTNPPLAASTTYYVLLSRAAEMRADFAGQHQIDNDSQPGWTLGLSFVRSGSTGPLETDTVKYVIRVNGTPGIPATDATLSALVLTGATLSQTFASATTTYTATVSGDVSQTTVTATPTNASATVAFFDASDTALTTRTPPPTASRPTSA